MRKYDEVQELIKRLRNNKVTLGHGEYGVDPLCELAAKELEAITAQLVSCDSQTTMGDNIVKRLRDYAKDDHERGCQGRYYDCSCGYDGKRDPLIEEAAARIEQLEAALREIESITVHSGGDIHGIHPSFWEMAFKQAQDNARAALERNAHE